MWRSSFVSRVRSFFNFYSHIPCGMWRTYEESYAADENFYSHIPCGMWRGVKITPGVSKCISTHTSRVGCDRRKENGYKRFKISTHTSRVGCDMIGFVPLPDFYNFYSHIPCGMWQAGKVFQETEELFLLTQPVWDVTAIYSILQPQHPHISRDGLIIHLELY